jgi:hypothetical protein
MFVDRLIMPSRLAQGVDLSLLNQTTQMRRIAIGDMNSKDVPFVGRRDFSFGLLAVYQAPRGSGFEPVLTESRYVHRSEDVCYRVQPGLLFLDE